MRTIKAVKQIKAKINKRDVGILFLQKRFDKGAFTNYVYKRRGVGGQKKTNLVDVVCERPPATRICLEMLLLFMR